MTPVSRPIASLVLLTVLAATTGCTGSLFKVKPATELPPLPPNTSSTEAGPVTLRVAPLLTDEESQELFEANLPLSGVLPLRVELVFQSGVPVELKKARFRLRDSQNREWKLLSPKSAISRIMKANGVTLYNPNSRKQFEQEFGAYAIDLKTSAATPLSVRSNVSLLGVDGLYAVGQGRLIGTQNGTNPHRVIHIAVDGTNVTSVVPVVANHAEFDEPTLGVPSGELFYFVANSQWNLFDEKGNVTDESKLKPVVVLKTKM
jgi:hypothetical protein